MCPCRKSLDAAQSLRPKPRPRSLVWRLGMANAPNARIGVSFSNSRRFIRLSCGLADDGFIPGSRKQFAPVALANGMHRDVKSYQPGVGFAKESRMDVAWDQLFAEAKTVAGTRDDHSFGLFLDSFARDFSLYSGFVRRGALNPGPKVKVPARANNIGSPPLISCGI